MTESREGFRPAGPGDLEALLELQAEFYREGGYRHRPGEARRAWEALLSDSRHGRAWILRSGAGDRALGYVVLTFGFSLEYLGTTGWLDELYLRPEARKRGFGGAAVRIVDEACAEAGMAAVHLEVERGNAVACGIYRRAGYADNGRMMMTKWFLKES